MEETEISAASVVEFLNELLKVDRCAVAALLANRVPCNQAMADHPTVQVAAQHGGYHVGMFGILNGLFGTHPDGWGKMMYIFDDDHNLVEFALTDPDPKRRGVD